MISLSLHEFHAGRRSTFADVNGMEVVDHYGDPGAEHHAVRNTAGLFDLSFRGRLCLTGADRQKFLNGQVTNNVAALKAGEGCYAALITAKGKMQSDLNIFLLENEILLDFEPGLAVTVAQRLEKYIIADDVQVIDVAPHYGLLSVQGPQAASVIERLQPGVPLPQKPMSVTSLKDATLGEIYFINQPRTGSAGFDVFVPLAALAAVADKLLAAVKEAGGTAAGWRALEMARIEAGIPRFGADMDENNLPPEAGIDTRAISYSKGCYIGQEIIARIRTYGQVAKALRGLQLADDLAVLPSKGDKLYLGDKEIGFITSALASPALKKNIALGYVRREGNKIGSELKLKMGETESPTRVVALPFEI